MKCAHDVNKVAVDDDDDDDDDNDDDVDDDDVDDDNDDDDDDDDIKYVCLVSSIKCSAMTIKTCFAF